MPGTSAIRVIVTGTTGMVGEGVLHECLNDPRVEAVLSISRKPTGISHPKLRELVHKDFFNFEPAADQLSGYDACYFCLGVTSIGKKEPEYFRLTHTLTMALASVLSRVNPDMTFCYVSGASTDSTEKGRSMWARVKGKTENDLQKLPFKAAYAFRPGYIHPMKGTKHTHGFYKYIDWMYPAFRSMFPKYFCSLQEIARAMIKVTTDGYSKPILEVPDIVALGS